MRKRRGDEVIVSEEQIFLDSPLKDKKAVLQFISEKALEQGVTNSKEQVLTDFLARETEYSTAVQEGIAIPHAKSSAVKQSKLYIVRLQQAIDWDSPEFKVQVIFAILVPKEESGTEHIRILSNVATQLLEEEFQQVIFHVKDPQSLLKKLNIA